MMFGDKPESVPIPLFIDHVSDEMDWEKQNDKIKNINHIKKLWPHIFDRKNLLYISNLKFVQINLQIYKLDYRDYVNGKKPRPHFMDADYAKELTQTAPSVRINFEDGQITDDLDDNLLHYCI